MAHIDYGHESIPDETHIRCQPDGSVTIEVTPPSRRQLVGISVAVIGAPLIASLAFASTYGVASAEILMLICLLAIVAASLALLSILRRDSRHAWISADRVGLRMKICSLLAHEQHYEWTRTQVTRVTGGTRDDHGVQALIVETTEGRTELLREVPEDRLRRIAEAISKALQLD